MTWSFHLHAQNGNTALHEAVTWHHPTTVKLLRDAGCRTNVPNTKGDIPMDIATRKGYNDIVAQLSSRDLMESLYGCEELQRFISQRKDSLRADHSRQLSWPDRKSVV